MTFGWFVRFLSSGVKSLFECFAYLFAKSNKIELFIFGHPKMHVTSKSTKKRKFEWIQIKYSSGKCHGREVQIWIEDQPLMCWPPMQWCPLRSMCTSHHGYSICTMLIGCQIKDNVPSFLTCVYHVTASEAQVLHKFWLTHQDGNCKVWDEHCWLSCCLG